MYQIIGEKVDVAGVYSKGRFHPKKFAWKGRAFVIDQVASCHDFKDGSVRKRQFAVVANGNTYLLNFDRDIEQWVLQQIWVEA